jgi:hypothetical protein
VLAAYGPLALVNQPFWDDWVMIGYSNAGTLWELFKQLGRREQYILMAPFTGHGDARACVMTVLLLYCLLAPLIYTIIRRTTRWPATEAFWAALLTAVVPLDQARFVVSTVPYAFPTRAHCDLAGDGLLDEFVPGAFVAGACHHRDRCVAEGPAFAGSSTASQCDDPEIAWKK